MVFPILIAIVSAPALLGTQEAIRQSQSKEKREEHRARRCNLIASCVKSSMRSREINGRPIVLRDGKLWVDTGTSDGGPFGHPYAGYYLPYPDSKYEGLVTTITDVAPIMNWVYVDKDTYEVKYGVRLDAQPNLTGPFDCTRQDRRLTFDGWEGWCAVEEYPAMWALYFDQDDDGLRSKVAEGTRVLEIELTRKEKRWKKDGEERQKDQTTKRAVETKEDAPVDNPITAQPELSPPGVGVPNEEKAPEPLKPFGLPKSIFSDPPRPLFFGQEMLQPRSPPPAYYQDEEVAPPPVEEIVLPPPAPKPGVESEPERPPPLATAKTTRKRPETPPQNAQAAPPGRAFRESAFETPRQAPVPPVRANTQTTPIAQAPAPPLPANTATTPVAPAPLKVSPPTEKRPTPKLNRMSGTRAMSQAQMFEAWATGQPLKNETTAKRPESRPISNATSRSDYSNSPAADEDEVLRMYGELRDSTILPLEQPPLQPSAPITVSDPAVFARLSSGSSTTSDPAVVRDKVSGQGSMRRKSSFTKPTPVAPKEPLPPLPTGVFQGNTQRRSSPERGPRRAAPLNRRQASTSSRDRDLSLDRPLRPNVNTSRDSPRSTRNAVRPVASKELPASRDRNGSTSSQSRTGDSSRSSPVPRQRMDPPLQRGERPSPRPLTRTNTAPVRDGVDRSRTTSSLYREIDNMVSTGRDRSGSTASNASSTRRNGPRAEDREPPLRRTMTSREPRRNETARSTSDRSREAARGFGRRGDREPERRY